jgi:BirA family biotin operon repressor/biotin-[acetyl-CoA-carboxylase] ligase
MDLNKLLFLLSDGNFHSGSELGDALKVSRTSIWKAIPSLQEFSVPIEIVKGKGYRVTNGLDLLDKNKIISLLPQNISSIIKIDILLSYSSTNDYLSTSKHDAHFEAYHACLAESQTAGRGRRGRSWVSPFAKNISLSVSFFLEGGAEALSGLSLVVGIAVAKTLEGLGVEGVCLKWPNDVYVGERKIAGVLLELSGEATTSWKVVCGIGLNVHMEKIDGVSIDQSWCSLDESVRLERNVVVAKLLEQLFVVIELFKQDGFNYFLEEWSRLDMLRGKQVVVHPSGIEGKVVGVNLQGALTIKDDKTEHVINAGEVSVRKK